MNIYNPSAVRAGKNVESRNSASSRRAPAHSHRLAVTPESVEWGTRLCLGAVRSAHLHYRERHFLH